MGPHWRLRTQSLTLDRPRVMGILNLTPDSFSDGGRLGDLGAQLGHARRMIDAGADLLDVGGESTRPGAAPVSADEEWARIEGFMRRVPELGVPVSVDTRHAEVARRALECGAEIVNDVSALAHDPTMGSVVARAGAGLVLMHMRGDPGTMHARTAYRDVAVDVRTELGEALERARAAGVADDRILLDPGIGFAKTVEQSLELLGRLDVLFGLGRPLLLGPSRKRFLAGPEGLEPLERVPGTVAACILGFERGASVFRVHDVLPARRGLEVARRVREAVRRGAER